MGMRAYAHLWYGFVLSEPDELDFNSIGEKYPLLAEATEIDDMLVKVEDFGSCDMSQYLVAVSGHYFKTDWDEPLDALALPVNVEAVDKARLWLQENNLPCPDLFKWHLAARYW